jgi:cardiolipin synthase (CMP-forming)
MAVATDREKSRPRRAAERDVDRVLDRSPSNLANLITVSRLLMVIPLIWLIATDRVHAAFWLLVVAGMSDLLDGYIAKNFNARTELGAYLDPIADKTLLDGIYVALALAGWLPPWLAMLVVGRDVLIVLGVALIQRRHPVFRARPLLIGKVNTFAQLSLGASTLAHAGGVIDLGTLVTVLIGAVVLTTVLSGAGYAGQAMRVLAAERAS